MAFKIGQKVVCVDVLGNANIRVGAVYTIIGFENFPSGKLGLFLAEARHPGVFDCSFYAYRFRPLTERKADMKQRRAIFDKMKDVRGVVIPQDEQV